MSSEIVGLTGFGFALLLTLFGLPVGIAMGVVGVLGFAILSGWFGAGFILGSAPFEAVVPYGLSVVPLFIAMGVFAARAGLSRSLFEFVNFFVGRFRGGLAIAAIGACGIFGAICGSSLATAATMGRIAIPEMQRAGYANSISAATVAAGGTLGVLIPPSVLLVIYGLLTETSIGELFIGALVPGVLAIALYVGAIVVSVRLNPSLVSEPVELAEKQPLSQVFRTVLPLLSLIILVIGGLYIGLFSPTEAAAVGAVGAVLLTIFRGTTRAAMLEAALETATTTAMIFMILIGAALFNFFIEGTGLTRLLTNWVDGSTLSPFMIMTLILIFYVVLGCFMDAMSMILLTIPVTFPIAISLGFDPVWFGIIVVSVAEIGLITPPIGMNLFIIQGVAPDVKQSEIMRGIVPFIVADLLRIALLLLIPAIVLFLPLLMRGG